MIGEPRKDQLLWLDGAFVPWAEATMHVSAHHYGLGVFEGLRAYDGAHGPAIFRLGDHTARLFRSARIARMAIPERYEPTLLNEVQLELLRKNGFGDAYLRPFVFYSGTLGLAPTTRDLTVHVAVMALEWRTGGAYQASEALSRGIALKTTSFVRHAASALAKAKLNGNYVSGILARQDAQASNADDALLLDSSGFVAETSGANVFVVSRGAIYTPPLESVLDGVTRDTVIELASLAGFEVRERRLTREDVYAADEVFLTGTAVEVTPVRELDARKIGSGARGPVCERIQALYAAAVRGRQSERDWLSPIESDERQR